MDALLEYRMQAAFGFLNQVCVKVIVLLLACCWLLLLLLLLLLAFSAWRSSELAGGRWQVGRLALGGLSVFGISVL